jgi:hypothetical protein
MTPPRRELVIEVECVRVVRRRVKALLEFCSPCGGAVDAVEASDLSSMFEITEPELLARLIGIGVHVNRKPSGDLSVCYRSLQVALHRENLLPRTSLPGE